MCPIHRCRAGSRSLVALKDFKSQGRTIVTVGQERLNSLVVMAERGHGVAVIPLALPTDRRALRIVG
jgi:hypothetical protein